MYVIIASWHYDCVYVQYNLTQGLLHAQSALVRGPLCSLLQYILFTVVMVSYLDPPHNLRPPSTGFIGCLNCEVLYTVLTYVHCTVMLSLCPLIADGGDQAANPQVGVSILEDKI